METVQPIVIVPTPNQSDYKAELLRMYRQNYKIFRKEELRNRLLDYFYYLEREITGHEVSSYLDNQFTIKELEDMLGEMETELTVTQAQKQRVEEILSTVTD